MIPLSLAGKLALVTGAARGLGAAIADMLAAAGAEVARLDIVEAPGIIACDVRDEGSLARALAQAAPAGRLDIVIANAGIVPPWREIETLDFADFDATMAVNVRGVAATFRQAVPLMKAHGGAIVATASIMSYRAHARQAGYIASKHAVAGLVKAAALDLGRYGIRVNAVAPGSVATEALVGRIDRREAAGIGPPRAEALAAAARETALGRMVSEADVAKAVLFLSSDLASGITGQVLPVEGGLE